MNQRHQIKSTKIQQNKILEVLYNQTCQVQQSSGDSSNIMSNNKLISKHIDRLSQIFGKVILRTHMVMMDHSQCFK